MVGPGGCAGNGEAGLPSRRQLLRRGAALALAVPSAAALLEACGSSSSSTSAGSSAASLAGTAVMTNYPDWMGAQVVQSFEKLHHGSVIKQVTNSSSSISGTVQQLKTGNFDFGLADVSATQQAVAIGLVQPPDWSKIPNIKYVGGSFRTAYPHGIPTDSGKIVFIDLDRDCMGSALKYLGYSGNSTVPSQLTACKNALIQIKPHLQAFLGVNYGQGLQDGSTVIAMDYDYDVALNQQKQPKIEWVYPSEGMVAYLEGWIAMKSSKVLPLVQSFMNFALEPKQYADFVNTTGTAYVESAATPFINKSISGSTVLRPGKAIGKVEFEHYLGQATALWTQVWDEVKAA